LIGENQLESSTYIVYKFREFVGVEALISTLGEEKGTIEDVHEPYLLKEGFLLRTSRGREISDKTWKILGGRKNQFDL